jgi:hypothetical protein
LLTIKKSVNGEQPRLIARNFHNVIGRRQQKYIGQHRDAAGAFDQGYLETQEYAYNIRGWLKSINWVWHAGPNPYAAFAEDVSYDWGFDNNQFNGNIAGVKWSNKGQKIRSYGYGYDQTNRLMLQTLNK